MGSDIQGESARLGECGPVTLVELPGAGRAWSVTDATCSENCSPPCAIIANGHIENFRSELTP